MRVLTADLSLREDRSARLAPALYPGPPKQRFMGLSAMNARKMTSSLNKSPPLDL